MEDRMRQLDLLKHTDTVNELLALRREVRHL